MKSLIMGCLGFILCCQTATAQQQFSPADFNQLCTFMTGSFSSELQSKRDTNYFDIRLQMAHIWPERTDGYWIYVEQAMVTALDKPYRQRIYRVNIKDAQTAESRVYTMK